ncbi:MAG: hypothetical protein ABI925_10340 [Verrucomicrobiota bacterium]
MSPATDKLWIAITRPDRLPTALAAVQAVEHRFPGGCYLLREYSIWWERANWEPYRDRFASVHSFARIESCRGFGDLPRFFQQNKQRQRKLAGLPINSETDVLLCLAGVLKIGNAVASAHPDIYKILGVPEKVYRQLTRTGGRGRYRFTTSGWLQNRLVEPLAGLERTIHFKPRINPGGDGVRIERLRKDPDEIYDTVIVMSNSGRELAAPNSHLFSARFPSMADLRGIEAGDTRNGEQDRHRRVIFFGTPFLLIHNLAPDVYIEHLNLCLDYLRGHYGENCDLIYRPHPAETNEAQRLNLEDFQIENDREAGELYFLRHFGSIEAVYSVSSTVSRTAYNNGLNAYSLWRCFPFPESAAKFFENLMGDVPPEFDVRDLAKPPVVYQDRERTPDDGKSFDHALNAAIDLREKALL